MTKDEKKYDRGSSGVHSIIGEGTIFEGNISVQGSLRIDGVFKGTIKCDAFYVGRSAEVTAEIEANRSVIGGKIHGNLVSPMSAENRGDRRNHRRRADRVADHRGEGGGPRLH
ncbi:MAG TPA: polymer-forming cytoskeletal protein [Candidatus Coatesbacteria bacterium]|nr:polymer-forming cytoskeletal protein [Candidatus Coatesbacteria bacterium]